MSFRVTNCGHTKPWVMCAQLNSSQHGPGTHTQISTSSVAATDGSQPYSEQMRQERRGRWLGQMLNTSIRVWSSFCCRLTPSSLARVILSVNYSIAWVKIRCKPSEMKRVKKALKQWGKKISPISESYDTAEVSVHQLYIIRYDTASCSSVVITPRIGRAGADD